MAFWERDAPGLPCGGPNQKGKDALCTELQISSQKTQTCQHVSKLGTPQPQPCCQACHTTLAPWCAWQLGKYGAQIKLCCACRTVMVVKAQRGWLLFTALLWTPDLRGAHLAKQVKEAGVETSCGRGAWSRPGDEGVGSIRVS